MGKALSGKLSCPCDRSCLFYELATLSYQIKQAFQCQRGLGLVLSEIIFVGTGETRRSGPGCSKHNQVH